MEKKEKYTWIICIITGILLIAPVICDGMINWFGLNQSIQYAYNFGVIVFGLPIIVFSTGLIEKINK